MAMAMNVLLGRRLLAPKAAATAETDSLEAQVARDDRFFCDTMELIPAQHYFPTDEEENWLKSAPKNGKKAKYHREVLAQKQQGSSKQAVKRAKFNPSEQKTNEERQQEAADAERKQKAALLPVAPAKDPSAVSIDGLKERLQAKLQALREQRHADGQTGKKRPSPATNEPASKKRKAASQSSAFNQKALSKKDKAEQPRRDAESGSTAPEAEPAVEVSAGSISYGSLLLPGEEKAETKKTRNGQALRGIKNLLKKAERNQQRMEELKKTEEGKALVQAKNWNKALKQAAGEVVMDDPKLLRKKLKKKEKQKAKSSKEWKKRTAQVEMQKKERQKKRLENLRTGGKKDKDKDKSGAAPRAGFEGKKGESFLNADKSKSADKPKKKE
ncbi:hypothetical protein PINS_up003263 [Pythium insidiosum]|nr:hypothetical protein PINS_up003263 [Pythium insidiosum]